MSILHYQPTKNILDTGRNARGFVQAHMDAFWDILKPLMPFLAACLFLDLAIGELVLPKNPETGESPEFKLFTILGSYFFCCLSISWHRVVIHGPDHYSPMNPWKPTKNELLFIGAIIGLIIATIFAMVAIAALSAFIGTFFIPIALCAAIIAAIFIGCRCSFFFPARATGNNLTLMQAFALSKGYVLRMILTPFIAMWKVMLIYMAYVLLGIAILFGISGLFSGAFSQGIGAVILLFLFGAPIQLYFEPLFLVIGVTVLSNFYQYAQQNPPLSLSLNTEDDTRIAASMNDIEPS